jgi:hypothetical protein
MSGLFMPSDRGTGHSIEADIDDEHTVLRRLVLDFTNLETLIFALQLVNYDYSRVQ